VIRLNKLKISPTESFFEQFQRCRATLVTWELETVVRRDAPKIFDHAMYLVGIDAIGLADRNANQKSSVVGHG
jgi:hypothetical protein